MMKADKLLKIMSSDFQFDDAFQQNAYDRLEGLANSFGAPVIRSLDTKEYPYGWSGEYFRIVSQSRYAFDLAHEIAHFLISVPERRKLAEFGLGSGFSTMGDVDQIVPDEVCTFEEDCACLLAALLLDWVGLPNKSESELVQFVFDAKWNEDFGVSERIPELIEKMIEFGLIDDDLKLTFKLREN
jgi:hypothetical protein